MTFLSLRQSVLARWPQPLCRLTTPQLFGSFSGRLFSRSVHVKPTTLMGVFFRMMPKPSKALELISDGRRVDGLANYTPALQVSEDDRNSSVETMKTFTMFTKNSLPTIRELLKWRQELIQTIQEELTLIDQDIALISKTLQHKEYHPIPLALPKKELSVLAELMPIRDQLAKMESEQQAVTKMSRELIATITSLHTMIKLFKEKFGMEQRVGSLIEKKLSEAPKSTYPKTTLIDGLFLKEPERRAINIFIADELRPLHTPQMLHLATIKEKLEQQGSKLSSLK